MRLSRQATARCQALSRLMRALVPSGIHVWFRSARTSCLNLLPWFGSWICLYLFYLHTRRRVFRFICFTFTRLFCAWFDLPTKLSLLASSLLLVLVVHAPHSHFKCMSLSLLLYLLGLFHFHYQRLCPLEHFVVLIHLPLFSNVDLFAMLAGPVPVWFGPNFCCTYYTLYTFFTYRIFFLVAFCVTSPFPLFVILESRYNFLYIRIVPYIFLLLSANHDPFHSIHSKFFATILPPLPCLIR